MKGVFIFIYECSNSVIFLSEQWTALVETYKFLPFRLWFTWYHRIVKKNRNKWLKPWSYSERFTGPSYYFNRVRSLQNISNWYPMFSNFTCLWHHVNDLSRIGSCMSQNRLSILLTVLSIENVIASFFAWYLYNNKLCNN